MNLMDRLVGVFSPQAAFRRVRFRRALAAYESARPPRQRRHPGDNSSGDVALEGAGEALRAQARHLDQNHDLAVGVFNVLVNNVIGPHGIGVEPQPRERSGEPHRSLADALSVLYADWCKTPEVTGQLSWAKAQRLAFLTQMRDGEVFCKELLGYVPLLRHGTRVPYTLELLEPDFCPFEHNDPGQNIVQGVQCNAWGRPTQYHFLDAHPGAGWSVQTRTRAHDARQVIHLKTTRRLHQRRGVSVLAPVLARLSDIKDYEESERVAARVAAAAAFYIKKGEPSMFDESDPAAHERTFSVNPGMVFDDLAPGEDVGTIESKRPSALLSPFRDAMLKAVSAGTMTSYSSIAKNYNGTYSAQRQELVEQWGHYLAMSTDFIGALMVPTYERFVRMAVMSGALRVPTDLDPASLYDADYIPPSMPWIDVLKEARADSELISWMLTSPQRVMRRRGLNPRAIMTQYEQWVREIEARGIGQYFGPSPPAPDPDDEDDNDNNNSHTAT